jgi:hypothetical protein
MHSPDTTKHLQGASRTSGGVSRGRALGNIFNFADVKEVLTQHPNHGTVSKGRVYVYLSSSNPTSLNPETMNPMATVKVTTSPTIAPILQQVTRRFSPVRSKYTSFIMLEYYLAIVLENNRHIYVLENSVWDLKGRYNMAIEDDDDLDWVTVNGENVTSMLVVGDITI